MRGWELRGEKAGGTRGDDGSIGDGGRRGSVVTTLMVEGGTRRIRHVVSQLGLFPRLACAPSLQW